MYISRHRPTANDTLQLVGLKYTRRKMKKQEDDEDNGGKYMGLPSSVTVEEELEVKRCELISYGRNFISPPKFGNCKLVPERFVE